MPFFDGLPPVTATDPNDILPLCQGSTGTPGSGVDRKMTIAQLFAPLTHLNIADWAVATAGFFGSPGPAGPTGFNSLGGLTLSNDATTPNTVLDISAGACADSANAVTITLGAFTKSIAGSWVAGTGANGMGVGLTATLSTWYHVYAVIVSGTPDVYFDTSATAANKPAGTSAFRRIGSFKLDAAIHILQFNQYADRFDWDIPILEISGTPLVTTALTKNLIGVPPGVPVAALITGAISDSTSPQSAIYFSSLAQTDLVPGGTSGITGITGPTSGGTTAFSTSVMTNASAQIRYRLASATIAVNAVTNGWIDTRGRG